MHDILIVGGGIIGLSIARELAPQRSVLVLNRGNAEDAASWAAAGMLAPQSEASGPSPFLDLLVASLRGYRAWAGELQSESGIDPQYSDPGLLYAATSEKELCELRRAAEWQRAAGFEAELLSAEEARRLEPNLTPALTGAISMPGEHHVTPRRLLAALRGSCKARGVDIRDGVGVAEILSSSGRVEGVRTSAGREAAGAVIVASGVGSGAIGGLEPHIPVSPRKGQILSVTADGGGFRRIIRWQHTYFVPRAGHELVIGATNEDAGYDRSMTPAGLGRLLESAQHLAPAVGGYPIREMWTGLRPATPDGIPVIGHAAIDGLVYATGHYRNGILLAPITAFSVKALVEGRFPPVDLAPCTPFRFEV